MNPMDRIKQKGLETAVDSMDVRNHPLIEAVATIIAQLEHEQAHAVARCIDAGDLALPIEHDVEDRREILMDVAEAVANDELDRLWFEDLAEIERPDTARQYIDLDADEWREQLEKWYESYEEKGVVDQPVETADREAIGHIAALHIRNTYDVDVDEFVAGVVNWRKREALEHLLAGNIQAFTDAMKQTADVLEELQDENKRLRDRVHELDTRLDAIDESSPDNGEE